MAGEEIDVLMHQRLCSYMAILWYMLRFRVCSFSFPAMPGFWLWLTGGLSMQGSIYNMVFLHRERNRNSTWPVVTVCQKAVHCWTSCLHWAFDVKCHLPSSTESSHKHTRCFSLVHQRFMYESVLESASWNFHDKIWNCGYFSVIGFLHHCLTWTTKKQQNNMIAHSKYPFQLTEQNIMYLMCAAWLNSSYQ